MNLVGQKYRQAAVAELKHHPKNPRHGDVGAIHESIEANGFYGALVVQKSTGYVLAGNHRLAAAVYAGAKRVPVLEVDCDDETALRILVVDNRSSDLATNDDDLLAEILVELAATEAGLAGTGHDGDSLDDLLNPFVAPLEIAAVAEPFMLTFDDEAQRADWFSYLDWLADRYPDETTVGARVTRAARETMEAME